jgi:hypothetical protein
MRHPSVLLVAIVALSIHSAAATSFMFTTDTTDALSHARIGNWHKSKRLLDYEDRVDEEERGISSPSAEMLQGWLKKGLISDDAVGLLTLGNKADDLLTSSLLNA